VRKAGVVVLCLLAWLPLWESPGRAEPALRPIPTVIHVHSTWSTGDQTLDELATRARERGIEAVFLTENHLQRYEYGLPPLRGLIRYRREYPSVLAAGPEAFLAAVAAANDRQKDVVLVPGVEVVPRYYWTGRVSAGTLTMHDAQKNLLALGLYRAEDYWDLPVVGNVHAGHWGLYSLWLLSPALLVIPGVWLLRMRRRREIRLQHFRVTEDRRLILPGVLCLGAAVLLLVNNYPFRVSPVSPYETDAGLAPHQRVIDFVVQQGGLVAWSLPEAKDHQVVTVAGLRATIHTDPYPSDLLRTDRFAAFGGIYEDTTTFTEPGLGWDQLLLSYLNGLRAAPAWAIGESAYHAEGHAGKRLGDVQTVVLTERKDAAGLLQAIRLGRVYALMRTADDGLALNRFQVIAPDRPAAEAGGRLALAAGGRPEVQAEVRTLSGRRLPVEVRLIRSGAVIHSVRGETPLAFRWAEPPLPAGARLFFRLEVRGPGGHHLLSNPVFLQAS
jgi:hypothetical protein